MATATQTSMNPVHNNVANAADRSEERGRPPGF